jgi:hypothetical protein
MDSSLRKLEHVMDNCVTQSVSTLYLRNYWINLDPGIYIEL